MSFCVLIIITLLIGWFIFKNGTYKQTTTDSNDTVFLKLPSKDNKVLEYKEKVISGDNVFSMLKRVTDKENISLGYEENTDDFLLVYKIGEVGGKIMDCSLTLLVNNKEIIESPDEYYLVAGDKVEWVFWCEDK